MKRTCTSSPTIEVSVHSPSPTLKARRWIVKLPVAVERSADWVIVTGSFTIQRLAFKVGEGEWTDTSMVGDEVQVRFKLVLTGLRPL